MLDRDLAELYGVTTGNLNKAVKRNLDRFPDDFMFQLSDDEFENLKSQIVISSWGGARRAKPLIRLIMLILSKFFACVLCVSAGLPRRSLGEGGSAAHHKQLDKAIQFIYKKYIIIYKKYMECSHG